MTSPTSARAPSRETLSRNPGREFSRVAAFYSLQIFVGAVAALLLSGTNPADARQHHRYHGHIRHGAVGVDPGRESESIVIDTDTGRVLSETNADAITYPASLTKMMTLYLTFEALNAGNLRLDQ